MASLKLEHIYKVYPNGHKAVSDFNMNIEDGEFIVFVGPSGCGKSTTLRMIAGLEEITSGELYIGDTLVNDMQPKDRDIAMVFQNYALYPHMTVYENMAFGLTLRKVPRTEIHEKVMWAADVLGLREYLDRKPKAMSGGQRQRVSLGRAILRNPKVMLLDEPLSNLDAKLRSQMRSEISKLHQQLKTTFIYVTHDQVEAMTLGTRVVVMKLGRVQQIDSPQNLYDHPINKFVAGFIGTPQMNFFNVTLKEEKDKVTVNFKDCEQPNLTLTKDQVLKAEKKYLQGDKDIILGFRCEAITAETELVKGDNIVNVTISHFEELGNETLIYGDLKEVSGLGNDSTTSVIIKATSKLGYKPGDVIKAKIDVQKIHLFDAESEMTILPPIPDKNVLPVDIVNEKMNLFSNASKPESIPVDFVKGGTISLPIDSITVGKGKETGTILKIEQQRKEYLALVEAGNKKIFVLVNDKAKVGDKITFSVDYSKATFRDENDKLIASPLADKDDISATFVNLKTAYETTKNESFNQIRDQRINAVNDEYQQKEAEFAEKWNKLLEEAKVKEESLASQADSKRAEVLKENEQLKLDLANAKTKYAQDKKECKAKHAEIKKTEIAKIENQYKQMWAKEADEYHESMAKNKDADSRRSRRLSYQVFKESFPQMKNNDLERKTNALEFDKETELNAIKSQFSQFKNFTTDKIKQNLVKFNEEYHPYNALLAKQKEELKELQNKKKDDLLHAELIFFFKYEDTYQLIPDEITNKIIQGLGNKVFTKIFKIRVPHANFIKTNDGKEYKVVSYVNYGDVKMYKCTTDCMGEKIAIYINKAEELEIGQTISLLPDLSSTEIYETELNIRLY